MHCHGPCWPPHILRPPLRQGIAVELTIVVRPRVLVKTLVTAYKTDDSLPSKLLQACTRFS